jgi:hypothetical protein
VSETQPKLIEVDHVKRPNEKEAKYLKVIAEIKAYQEVQKLKDELARKLEEE